MPLLCLTAGTELADILWTANVLPEMRLGDQAPTLVWECPMPGIRPWLAHYPELDRIIGDVEELTPPPDNYLILHPSWSRMDPSCTTPLRAVFSLIEPYGSIPTALPTCPYGLSALPDREPSSLLPPKYIALDPHPGGGRTLAREAFGNWAAFIGRMPIPVVQVGPPQTALVPGAIDARTDAIVGTAATIRHAELFIGADSDCSCLTQALKKPQVWLEAMGSAWLWPRGDAATLGYKVENWESWPVSALVDLVMDRLHAGGGA